MKKSNGITASLTKMLPTEALVNPANFIELISTNFRWNLILLCFIIPILEINKMPK